MKTLVVFAALSSAAWGQTANLNATACRGALGRPRLLVFLPTLVGAMTVTVPACVALGAGFTVAPDVAGIPTLSYTPPPAPPPPPVPRMVLETVTFAPTTPATQLTMDWQMGHTPAPGTLILAVLRSSLLGWSTVDIVPFNATTPKTITISLPNYRPYPDDGLLLQYWTLEP